MSEELSSEPLQRTLDVWRMDARRVSQQAGEDATRVDQERILVLIDALERLRRTCPEVTITNSGGVATCEVSRDGVPIFSGVDRSALLQVDRSHVKNLADEWAARQGPTASDDLYADLLHHAIESDREAEGRLRHPNFTRMTIERFKACAERLETVEAERDELRRQRDRAEGIAEERGEALDRAEALIRDRAEVAHEILMRIYGIENFWTAHADQAARVVEAYTEDLKER